jgi:non-specific serine/threonine protein kinase
VPAAVAKALGVPEVAGRPILDAVTDHLRERQLLLIVDNFEQVVEASPVVETLLAAAPRLTVLVTSRIVLALHGEQEYEVSPLEPPDPDRLPDLPTLRGFEAVRLFAERATAVEPRFEITEHNARAVAGITARLDGLPLAIELAATRTKVLTPEQMLPRLEKRLSLLTSRDQTLPERQRTLRGAIAWSYDLLDEPERRLFARLSVFTGGWAFEAAEAVCEPEGLGLDALEGLTSLLDKSLIRAESMGDDRRFLMLETIREFGLEQLGEAGEFELLLRRHAEHYLVFAAVAESHLTGADQREWLDRCDREHPNLRAALRWAIAAGDAEGAQAAAGSLWRFWQQRGHLAEGRRWLAEILAMPSGQGPTAARAKALTGAAGIAWWQEDRESAGASYREALDIERALDDPARIGWALYNLSFVVAGDDLGAATRMLQEALELFRRAGEEHGTGAVLALLLMPDAAAGNWTKVTAGLAEVVAIWRRLGERVQLAFDLVWLAYAEGRMGRRAQARAAALEALDLFREADNPTGIGIALTDLAFLAVWEGRHEDALRLAGAADSVRTRIGGPPGPIGGFLEGDPVADAREHLRQDDADRAWAEGNALTLDEAVAAAHAATDG